MTPSEQTRPVLIIQRRLAEYRVPFFEALRGVLAGRGVRLAVAHGTPAREERARMDGGRLPWAIRGRTRYLSLFGVRLSWVSLGAVRSLRTRVVVITHENGILSNYYWFILRLLGGPPVVWWGHGPKVVGRTPRLRERLKAVTATLADGYFAYTSQSVERAIASGVPREAICCLNNAVDTGTWPEAHDERWEADRTALRRTLGLEDGPVAISLGSITREKRPEFLLEAALALRDRVPGFQLLVLGDGPQAETVRRASEQHSWIRWLGACHGREKALACSLGQILLNPGMIGLTIVDAFGFGLPTVTTENDSHSPEIAYLEHGRNGLILENSVGAFVDGVESILRDPALGAKLRAGCRDAARRITIATMAENFADGISRVIGHAEGPTCASGRVVPPLPRLTVAFVVRSLLQPHVARLRSLHAALEQLGARLVQIEVASSDAAYGFGAAQEDSTAERYCCFPGRDYQELTVLEVHARVVELLREIGPDVVFGHATPFPEGMAAIRYRNESGARFFLFEDAWGPTDRSGPLVRWVKRLIHRSVDGAIVSSWAHAHHLATLGVPLERIRDGWSVVDNEYHRRQARLAWTQEAETRTRLQLPQRYFLYVGRFLGRKGIDTLLAAYERSRALDRLGLSLLLIGGERADLDPALPAAQGVRFCGKVFGDDLSRTIALADALVVPSRLEQWGLVTNEALASGTPVVVSRACGSAQLVADGTNGFTFEAGDVNGLAAALGRIATMSGPSRVEMRRAAEASVANWGLERFNRGVLDALELTRRRSPSFVPASAAWLWHGRVRAY